MLQASAQSDRSAPQRTEPLPNPQTPFSELSPRNGPEVFVALAYPPEALAARIEGAVVVRVTTDASGRVIAAEPLSGPAALVPAVLDSVKQWTVSRSSRTGVIVYRFEIDHARCNDDGRSLFRLKKPNLAVVTACTKGGARGIVSPTDQLDFVSMGGPAVYPSIAFAARVTGVVVLELSLDAKGMVVDSRPLTEVPLLTEAAVAHSKTWRFEPTERRRGIFVYEFDQDLRTCDDRLTDFWRVTADFWRLSTCSPLIGGAAR